MGADGGDEDSLRSRVKARRWQALWNAVPGTTEHAKFQPIKEKVQALQDEMKGTGKWTSTSGLDLGVPIPQIAEAVFARCISAVKEQRVRASEVLPGPDASFSGDRAAFIKQLHGRTGQAKIRSVHLS